MQRLIIISIITIFSITTFSQTNIEAGNWFRFADDQLNDLLFDQFYELASDTFFIPPLSSNNSFEPHTIYWNGNEWLSSSESSQQRFLLVMPVADNSARIVLSVDAAANQYDVFTDDGWVHVNNGLQYNFEEDYLHYDESNNRLIMFKQNIPWLFYLTDEE